MLRIRRIDTYELQVLQSWCEIPAVRDPNDAKRRIGLMAVHVVSDLHRRGSVVKAEGICRRVPQVRDREDLVDWDQDEQRRDCDSEEADDTPIPLGHYGEEKRCRHEKCGESSA